MINLTPFVDEVDKDLRYSNRPESRLFQRYNSASAEVKEMIVLAMIGKLIEQSKRLQARN
ncbi:hypothetical protein DVQ97_20310 [Yersinia enterocolitica]|nr:hypothetical protein [Yersinia enterocolitica]EKN5162919.1 hypothetical protein [Yersinia enterocolitica]EKN6012560.1 hypothetical protein [Yersinia enterocolitica]EKN6074481.1 hypothetical protein [Yersinia enterocolitica]